MSSSKAFVLPVKLRDALLDMKGLSLEAKGAFTSFWYLHELHREPLPPREEKRPRSEWDEWFRDKLDMKNVRTWRRVRDELLAAAKIRQDDDGRLYIGRTMRAIEEKRGGDPARWGGVSDQGALDLQGVHPACSGATREGVGRRPERVDRYVDKPVGEPVQNPQSPEVRPMIGQTSPDLRPIRLPKPLIFLTTRTPLSYSKSESHEVVAVISGVAARARGDPSALRA